MNMLRKTTAQSTTMTISFSDHALEFLIEAWRILARMTTIEKGRVAFGSHKSATTSRGTKMAILTTWGPINRFATVFTILINTFLWENFRLGAANAHMARLFMNIGFSPSRKGRQQFFPFCGWVNIMQQFFFFRSPFRKNEATPIKTEFLGAGLYGSPCFEWKAGLNKFSFAS